MSFENPTDNQSELSRNLDQIATSFSFGDGVEIKRLTNKEQFAAIKNSELGMDSRAKSEEEEGYATVFEGLDFDADRVRSQAYFLEKMGEIIAIITFTITPKKNFTEHKFLFKNNDGVTLCNFETVTGEMPDFVISPSWTKVKPAYQTKFALPGFKIIKTVLEETEKIAPSNTWLDITAQGKFIPKGESFKKMYGQEIGSFTPNSELPFPIDDFGIPINGAVSTVKLANLLGVPVLKNAVGSTLGPIYVKKIKN
jgi:hypothetical protein